MKDLDSESWINERAPDISLRELAAPLFRRKRVLITTFLVALTDPPEIPTLSTHGFPIVVLFALAFATVLAIAMAYLVEYFGSSFHTPAQVIDMLGIPVVVAVPKKTA